MRDSATSFTPGGMINPNASLMGRVLSGLFRPSPRSILSKAEREFASAYAARRDAEDRRDSRAMKATGDRLRTARNNLMAAQEAMPQPNRGVMA